MKECNHFEHIVVVGLVAEECQAQLRQLIEAKAVGSIKKNHCLRDGLDDYLVCVSIPKENVIIKKDIKRICFCFYLLQNNVENVMLAPVNAYLFGLRIGILVFDSSSNGFKE